MGQSECEIGSSWNTVFSNSLGKNSTFHPRLTWRTKQYQTKPNMVFFPWIQLLGWSTGQALPVASAAEAKSSRARKAAANSCKTPRSGNRWGAMGETSEIWLVQAGWDTGKPIETWHGKCSSKQMAENVSGNQAARLETRLRLEACQLHWRWICPRQFLGARSAGGDCP